ncbi:DUF6048 family protein [Myroides pelagicus]|uniref:Outer membrane beta-barrel protein n=1 Tax=Myroides pelagicus TaxID=270914 RepID=A0A7K1GQ89_9FLAO|nr:DUF6048 family protein [Myroides pelagicus]MEC4114805.1 DUF6048 family protein [Myroides pelagicus]MTH31021.1 hypothetical protein [Myroides pelagicus]
MKIKHILQSTIKGVILLGALSLYAQENNDPKEKQTTQKTETNVEATKASTTQKAPDTYPQRFGLRVGVDLFKLTRGMYDKTYQGFEIVGDYRINKNWWAAAELGTDKMERNNQTYGFTTKGNYIRIGGNYNVYDNWLDEENAIYVGFRYGFSTFSQNLDWYKVYTTDPYFPSPIQRPNAKYNGLSAHWVEFVTGVQAKLINNVFMGFSLRLNGLIAQKQPDGFENLYIPGFNKKHSGAIGVGFNYSITYFIPLYKSKKHKNTSAPENNTKYDLEGNKINQSEDLRIIEKNKKQLNK